MNILIERILDIKYLLIVKANNNNKQVEVISNQFLEKFDKKNISKENQLKYSFIFLLGLNLILQFYQSLISRSYLNITLNII